MSRFLSLTLIILTAASCLSRQTGVSVIIQPEDPPNIILVLTDDQGWADVGFNGSTDIPTPHLDRLAGQGTILSNGYVSHPYCSPSRAGLLTGRYQARFGHDCNMPYHGNNDETVGTPLSETMISEALKKQGYRTAAIGKWHVGDHPALHPPAQGFDHWFGFPGGAMNYWGDQTDELRTIYRNGTPVAPENLSYLTDDFTDETISFITDRQTRSPFFVYLAYNAPHAPDHAPAKYLERTKHIEYGGRSVYAAMVNAVDHGVGRIDSALIANGLKENTIIVFLSDNGGRGQYADNGPFRGYKGMLFEGGIKVPFFITWPAGLPMGKTYPEVVSALDLFPTLVEAAGGEATAFSHLDGQNLGPYLRGQKSSAPHDVLFWRAVGGWESAVRDGDYKLIENTRKGRTMLFNLADDPREQKDLAAAEPDIVQRLKAVYADWDRQNIDPGWEDPHIEGSLKAERRWEAQRRRATGPDRMRE
ncbi:sulfatase-like hydrolase/transferase [Neolewinella aurantiaca]|uniref:Sulfatase-like hydrolase/transferase n=1 Tax=Neolewinella aurantiaca TaxID=2602767 RepID=A0A5C7FQT8_9BACT|nr:sulfatase-like hydrolase/transferase [Neolewinella aurantiaca]TXF90220.1 sulfatase-like hydrolase/transferase [Neolewinella aurantiaca]